jgi:hypothetical protein
MLTDVLYMNAQALLYKSDEASRIMPPTQTSNLVTEICQAALVKI